MNKVGSSLELQALADFRMTILWEGLHMVGILFSMKHFSPGKIQNDPPLIAI